MSCAPSRIRRWHPRDALLLVPARRRWRDLRLRAERALYVDYLSHPFLAREVAEWRRRVSRARAFETATTSERAAICREAGTSLSKALRCTIYVTDLVDFAAVNEVYAAHFEDEYPARACVQVAALPKGGLVEIDAVVAI